MTTQPVIASNLQATLQSEEYYRLLVENFDHFAFFLLTPSGHIATWNAGAQHITHYSSEESMGEHISILYPDEVKADGLTESELQIASEKGVFEQETWRVKKDGTLFWASIRILPVLNGAGELIGYSKTIRDLSLLKMNEEALQKAHLELKESEKRLRLLIDSVKDYAILMLDPKGNIVSWNTGAERIKGYTPDEIIGRHFSTFYTPDAIEKDFPQFELEQAIKLGRFEDEGWRLRKEGPAFWANVIISPIYDAENQLLGFAKITRDLTERRRNEELMEKNKELVRINNELDNFVYTASHDLKSPVVNLEGLLTALNEDLGEECSRHSQVLSKMDNAIHTLKNVIDDLADVTRLQQGKEKAEKVNLLQLVGEIKDSLHETINESQADLVVDIATTPVIFYSRKNLRSVLYNLISNAIKYAHPLRLPQVRISTSLAESGELELSVSDNGLGLDTKQTKKIFSLFKRAHDHVEGSGVGLYLVRKILENSGDRITVQSVPGEGSVFRVFFRQKGR